MEIVGSQLDYILEMGVNAPVVSRRIPIEFFESRLSKESDIDILTETKCKIIRC